MLNLEALDIDISTDAGPFGVRLNFRAGLNVLSARNSSGKSTCLQALLYALGLESVFSGSQRPVFAPVVTTQLQDAGGTERRVLSSRVFLQFSNEHGDTKTVFRSIRGPRDSRLVTVYDGPLLTSDDPAIGDHSDYFTSVEGSAQRERGFHYFLARFLGFELPLATRFDGTEVPLYLQTFAPLFFVDQKRGWSGIQSNTPTFMQIKDVQRRAAEYVLGLDISETIRRRTSALEKRQHIQGEWSKSLNELNILAARLNGRPRFLETALSSQLKPPTLDVLIQKRGHNVNLDSGIRELEAALAQIDAKVMPQAEEQSDEAARQIQILEEQLALLRVDARMLYERTVAEEGEVSAIRERLRTLREDRKRNLDAKRLSEYGSDKTLSLTLRNCPTCGQSIADTIVPQVIAAEVLSLEDQLGFINSQVEAFEAVLPSTEQAATRSRGALNDLRESIARDEQTLSDYRSIITGRSSPTLAAMRQRVQAETDLHAAQQARDDMLTVFEQLKELYAQYRVAQEEYARLPKGDLSERDIVTVQELSMLLRSQLAQYGFRSVGVDEVEIAPDTYRPTARGMELWPQVSASDGIRLIWAYIAGLLELSRSNRNMHHIGLVVFDEPRQQEAEHESYDALCERLSATVMFSQQAIVASSLINLSRELEARKLAHTMTFGDRVIQARPNGTADLLGIAK